MRPERWKQIESLYHAARERGRGVLEGTDPDLRAEVEKLLAQDSGDKILDRPAADLLTQTMTVEVAVGSQLGPYRIEAPIGAGGMGQVFRATDTRLGRSVAIKTSKSQFSERFERETRVISSLNHAHICTLYDVGPNYLVMELVEGETLAARLKRGKLSLDETLRYGGQIAAALAAAHARGIIHRDLKPGNIMVTKAGVKLLDFGLAKSAEDATLTASRVVMGTPAYMAPEQLAGKEADARTDIYAFGLVLFEMATGKRAPQGEMPSMEGVTSEIRPLVERCLVADPEERWQSTQDLKIQLGWPLQALKAAPNPLRRRMLPWLVAALATAAGAAVFFYVRPSSAPQQAFRLTVPPPEGNLLFGFHAVSPDGQWLAFTAAAPGQGGQLFLRRMDSTAAQPLAAAALPGAPFWSPDSRWIGFFGGDQLIKVSVRGGPPQVICAAPGGYAQGTWNAQGVILFKSGFRRGLYQVSAEGGRPALLLPLDASRQETSHSSPQFLPDGQHFVFFVQSGEIENRGIYIGSLGSPRSKRLLSAERSGAYAGSTSSHGYLLFLQKATLMAQNFDDKAMALRGEPEPVADRIAGIQMAEITPPVISVSEAGLLAYRQGYLGATSELVWFDRQGRQLGRIGEPGEYNNIALSPDETRLVVVRLDDRTAADDIWMFDLKSGGSSRFTFDAAEELNPVWSPAGDKVAFGSTLKGPIDLYEKPVSGNGDAKLLLDSSETKIPHAFSPKGDLLLYTVDGAGWALPIGSDRKPYALPHTAERADFSPNGRWIAYVVNESGRREVYVQSVPPSGGKWQISKAGGIDPLWSRDGRELYYIDAANNLTAVAVETDQPVFRSGTPKTLFPLRPFATGGRRYQVASNGQRFLVNNPIETPQQPITVFVNWMAGLKK